MIRLIIPLVTALILLAGCTEKNYPESSDSDRRQYLEQFENFLPDYFFDKGTWLGLVLGNDYLGLGDPLLLSDSLGYNLGEPLLKLHLTGDKQPQVFDIKNSFLPGRLSQKGTSEDVNITIESIFTNDQTALLAYTITNRKDQSQLIEVTIDLPETYDRLVSSNKITYSLNNAELRLILNDQLKQSDVSKFTQELEVPAGEEVTQYLAIQHRFKEEDSFVPVQFGNSSALFEENESRWFQYLAPYAELSSEKRLLAAKCIQTLVNNWRSPSGLFKYEGLFPSYYYPHFNGFWAWDSWRHAVALAMFEPEVAKNQIRTMYYFQDQAGMIADAVWRDPNIEPPNLRNTKPPLSGWAVYEVYKSDHDQDFVKEMLPKLLKYHHWWYEYRDHNGNGLCEFGSTDGTMEAAAWESGMDNAVRFDEAQMLKNSNNAWSLDQESVDLNAYLYAEKLYLIELAKVIGNDVLVEEIESEVDELGAKIREVFYDDPNEYFHDYNITSNERVRVFGPEAWPALWANVATPEQAKGVVHIITDTTRFNTYCPFPTFDASHPKFDPKDGYWRGPVWLDQVYLAIEGMRKYGFDDEADEMKEKLLHNAEGLLEKGGAIWENYDPRDGTPLNAKHFSWSAAHLLMLMNSEL